MLVELHGGQFANKGAHKMLLTTMDELRGRLPRIEFAADGCVGTAAERSEANISTIVFKRSWMGQRFFSQRLTMQTALGRVGAAVPPLCFGRVPLQAIDALVDLAGFAYSDQWGAKPTRDFSSLTQFYHSQSKPVVMLPQALGPFTDGDISENFRKVGQSASVIYARDRQSLAFAKDATSSAADIRLCPDLTFPVNATFHDAEPDRPVLLVPNIRVVDSSDLDKETYLGAFEEVVQLLADHVPVRIVIHDGTGNDLRVAEELNSRLANPIEIVSERDPWALKSLISKAGLVVGSRYHSLVAALSCGVPCVAVGWSHKYDELLSDFGYADQLFKLTDDRQAFGAKILDLSGAPQNQAQRLKLRTVATSMSETVREMWDDVADRLDRGAM